MNQLDNLTLDDMIILCYGTNDLDLKKKFSCTFQNIKKFLMKNNHTNILLMNIPHRYDKHNSWHVNKIITVLNKKLQKLVKVNPHISFLETFNDRNLYTNHSLHHNKLGKILVKLQLASFPLASFVKDTSNPIPLEWYETRSVTDGIEDNKQFRTSNHNSSRIKKVPVTRTKDFLWPT